MDGYVLNFDALSVNRTNYLFHFISIVTSPRYTIKILDVTHNLGEGVSLYLSSYLIHFFYHVLLKSDHMDLRAVSIFIVLIRSRFWCTFRRCKQHMSIASGHLLVTSLVEALKATD